MLPDPLRLGDELLVGSCVALVDRPLDPVVGRILVTDVFISCIVAILLGVVLEIRFQDLSSRGPPARTLEQLKTWRLPIILTVGLQIPKELVDRFPSLHRIGARATRRVKQPLHPSSCKVRVSDRATRDTHPGHLAEPMDQQGPRTDKILSIQKRLDHQRIRLGRIEDLRMGRPKPKIPRSSPSTMPKTQGSGHMLRGLQSNLRIRRMHLGNLVGRILTPPIG